MNLKFAWLVFLACLTCSVLAHETSNEYLNLDVTTNQQYDIQGKLQLSLININTQVDLDSNKDDVLNWQEIVDNELAIKQFIQEKLSIQANDHHCELLLPVPLELDKQFGNGYLPLTFYVNCSDIEFDNLLIEYNALVDQDQAHQLIINVTGIGEDGKGIASDTISANRLKVSIDLNASNWVSVLVSYIYQGVVHIFIGIDHILFLVVLLLTSVLVFQNSKWQPKLSNKKVISDTAWIITAFTLAHSITLTATALGWIVPSSRWVEFGIALTIVLTALNNLWPLISRLSWMTFAFGLLHGMGFASVLKDFGLNQDYTIISILAFNIGVEAGQLMILLALLPILLFCRNKKWYSNYGIKIGSVIIGLLALYWSIQRF